MITGCIAPVPARIIDTVVRWVNYHKFPSIQTLNARTFNLETTLRQNNFDVDILANTSNVCSNVMGRFLNGDPHAGLTFTGPAQILNKTESRAIAYLFLHATIKSSKEWSDHPDDYQHIREHANNPNTLKQVHAVRELMDIYKVDEITWDELALTHSADCMFAYPPSPLEIDAEPLVDHVHWELEEPLKPTEVHMPELMRDLVRRGTPWLLTHNRYEKNLPLIGVYSKNNKFTYLYGQPDFPHVNAHEVKDKSINTFLPPVNPANLKPDSNIELYCLPNKKQFADLLRSYAPYHDKAGGEPILILCDKLLLGGFTVKLQQATHPAIEGCFTISTEHYINDLLLLLARSQEIATYLKRLTWCHHDGIRTEAIKNIENKALFARTGFKVTTKKNKMYELSTDPMPVKKILTHEAAWTNKNISETYSDWYHNFYTHGH